MSLIKDAIKGTEMALIEMTLKIQYRQLSEEEEKEILHTKTKNCFSSYLQACIYGFGTNKLSPDNEITMAIINKLIKDETAAAAWAMNLGNSLHRHMPDKYPLDPSTKDEWTKKAARLNNPLGWVNYIIDTQEKNIANNSEWSDINNYLAIAAKVYHRLPTSLQKSINSHVNKIESKPNLDENKDVYLGLGKFYQELKKEDEAYLYFLKSSLSNSVESFIQCQTYIFNAKPDKLEKLLNNRLSQAANIIEALSQYNIDPEIGKNTLEAISGRFHTALNEIKAEAELIRGKLNSVQGNNYKKSISLQGELKKKIATIEDRLKQQDKIIEALPENLSKKY